MKKKILSLILAAILILQSEVVFANQVFTTGNPDTTDWFEWELPDDKLARGTAIDASIFLDAPAGKHGFARAEGEDIVFEDGTKIRFWGTTIVMQANFMSKEDSEKLVGRIARTGFNLVRFHHLDINRSNNIFAEGDVTTTMALDPKQLDKVFYLIHLLKERGIYIYMDLLVMRPAMPDDGIPAMGDLSLGWKFHGVFDPNLIELQKEYARQLLTTVNPYTGLALADDPALVMLQIHNENSVFQIPAGSISDPYYIGVYQGLFNEWLAKKYTTREDLEAAWKEPGKVGLEEHEDFNEGTVNLLGDGKVSIPDLYDQLNYSEARKQDYYNFTYDMLYENYENFKTFLREELGVKCLITSNAMGGGSNKRAAVSHLNLQLMDFTDNHTYKSHPSPNVFGTGGKLTSWNPSSIVSGGELHRSGPWLRPYGQPYVIGEWNVCSPGPYAAEGALLQSAVASMQNWHPVQFCMYSGTHDSDAKKSSYIPEASGIFTFFATYFSADHTSIQPAAALTFLRGDVRPAKGAFSVIYSKDDVLDDKVYRSAYLLGFENAWMYVRVGMACEETLDENELMTPEALEEAFRAFRRNEPAQDINWNKRMGIFRVDTEYTNIATGYIGDKKISLSFADIMVKNPSATIAINSVTKDTLAETDRILLTAVSKARNTGLVMTDDCMEIVNKGSGPMLMEPITADLVLKTTDDVKVYALDSSGQRKQEVPTMKTSEGYVSFSIGKEYKTVHYEIVK